MNLRDLLKKHEQSGVTFHSNENSVDIGVTSDQIIVQPSDRKSQFACSRKNEEQVKRLLEEFCMKTDNFEMPQ